MLQSLIKAKSKQKAATIVKSITKPAYMRVLSKRGIMRWISVSN